MPTLEIIDYDHGEIRAEISRRILRSWKYHDEPERRMKIRMAREFAEGWFQADKELGWKAGAHHIHIAGTLAERPIDECAVCGRGFRHPIHAPPTDTGG